ncbi:MAG: hypothetical protein ACP6IY_19350 [Promethearchaeia archaeon]
MISQYPIRKSKIKYEPFLKCPKCGTYRTKASILEKKKDIVYIEYVCYCGYRFVIKKVLE